MRGGLLQAGRATVRDVSAEAAGGGPNRGTALRSGGLGGEPSPWGRVSPGAGTDSLPALADRHADPGGGAAALRGAGVPHGGGEAVAPGPMRRRGSRAQGFREPGGGEVPSCGLAPVAFRPLSVHPLLCVVLATSPAPAAQSLPLCPYVCLSVCLQEDLLSIQLLLNLSESSLHQLTALLDCRGLHKVPGWPWGLCGGWVGTPH